jgi:hypothetical protein
MAGFITRMELAPFNEAEVQDARRAAIPRSPLRRAATLSCPPLVSHGGVTHTAQRLPLLPSKRQLAILTAGYGHGVAANLPLRLLTVATP